jgi:hypothetical protein
VTREEDTVDGDNLTRLETEDITDDNVVDGEKTFLAVTNALDGTCLLLSVEFSELQLLLVVVERADHDDDSDGNDDSDTFDPFERGLLAPFGRAAFSWYTMGRGTDGLVYTEGEGDDGGDGQEPLRVGEASECQ